MQEMTLNLSGMLSKGLRPEQRIPANANFLYASSGMIPREEGLVRPESLVRPITTTMSGQFPHILRGKAVTLLAGATAMSYINDSTWAQTAITTYDLDTPANAKAITGGGQWHWVDMGTAFLLTNGNTVVLKAGQPTVDSTAKVFAQTRAPIQTCCEFRGRAFMGGFDSGAFASTAWQSDWASHATEINSYLDAAGKSDIGNTFSLGENHVWWSTVGGGDVFRPFLTTNSTFTNLGDYSFLEWCQRNEAGYIAMPWQGSVLRVLPLNKAVMVYGEGGTTALYPASSPVTTMGMETLGLPGVSQRGAAGGDLNSHIWIDPSGNLWRITADLKPQRLGYKEWLSPLLAGDIVISHDPEEQEFYISSWSGTTSLGCYVLTRTGLGKHVITPTSVFRKADDLMGLATESTVSTAASVTTGHFDMGLRGLKFIRSVNIEAEGMTGLTVTAQCRYGLSETYTSIGPIIVNERGTATVNAAAETFRLVISGTVSNATDAAIRSVTANWYLTDRRDQRGPYANQPAD